MAKQHIRQHGSEFLWPQKAMVPSDRILKVCEHVVLETACGNFTEFTISLQLWI